MLIQYIAPFDRFLCTYQFDGVFIHLVPPTTRSNGLADFTNNVTALFNRFLFACSCDGVYINSVEQTSCSNGLIGLENDGGTVCCHFLCDQCGGPGCGSPDLAVFLSADDCCVSNILENGQLCSVTESSPCVLQYLGELTDASRRADQSICEGP